MDLREWLFRNRVSQTHLAKSLGITKQFINHLCHKKYRASPKLALEIEKFTGGGVKAEELILYEKFEKEEPLHAEKELHNPKKIKRRQKHNAGS